MYTLQVTVRRGERLPGRRRLLGPERGADAYVKLQCGRTTHESSVRPRTSDPEWDETFVFAIANPTIRCLDIEVRDRHAVLPDPVLGWTTIPLYQCIEEGLTGELPVSLQTEDRHHRPSLPLLPMTTTTTALTTMTDAEEAASCRLHLHIELRRQPSSSSSSSFSSSESFDDDDREEYTCSDEGPTPKSDASGGHK